MRVLGRGSLEVPTQEALLFAPLALETHLLLQVDKGDKTAELGGDPITAVFLTLSSTLDTSPSCAPRSREGAVQHAQLHTPRTLVEVLKW